MSVDISVNITEDVVDIIATPTVNIVNVTNSASINPGLYDLSQFTNTSVNPFVRTSGLSAYVPTTRTLTINGTTQDLSADRTFTVSTGITIGTTAITSGTVGRVLFQGTGNVVQQSSQLSWDNTNNALLVTTGKTFSGYNSGGSASDALKLELTGNGAVLGIQNSNASGFSGVEYLSNTGAPRVFTGFNNSNGQEFRFNNFATGGYIDFLIGGTSSFRVFNSRNIGIGTTTDAGFKLDVNGTARATSYTLGNYIINQASANLFSISNPSGASGSLFIYGGTTAQANIQINGSAGGNSNHIVFNLGTTARGIIFGSTGNWGINTTTDAGYKLDVNGTARFTGQTTYANNMNFGGNSDVISPSSNSGNFDFLSNLPIRFLLKSGSVERMRIVSSTGNILINTTTDVASSKLTIESTTQGFLPPRMTTTQKNAIASPATGLMVYDTTLNVISYYNGTMWI